MARPLVMSDLVTRCKQRANMESDDSISSSEWKSLISEVYGELYEEVVDAGSRHFETSTSFTMSGAAYVAVPADQLTMVDTLEIVLDAVSGRCRRLYPIQPQERALYAGQTGDPIRYELVDDRFYLYPTPATGTVVTLRYVAQSTDLSAALDADEVDVVCSAGESFLIWGVAAIAKAKDERFVDFAETQKEKARGRLQQWARNRAFNQTPRRIVENDNAADGDWRGAYE